jgi:hypothetical protein
MTDSDVDSRAVDAAGVVDHKITLAVTDDVEYATNLCLQVLDFVAVCMKLDHSYGFVGICGDNKGIHASGWSCGKSEGCQR